MHKLLARQLRRHFGDGALPAGLEAFLADIDRTYQEAEDDRRFIEHSLELTSQELLQRNAALRAKQREQQVIFDAVPALIIYKDTQNRMLRLNESAARTFGGTVASLEGKRTEDVFPPDVARRLHEDDLLVIQSGQPRLGIEEAHPGAGGSVRWFRTDKVPYVDDRGAVVGVIVFSVDITQRKAAEQALAASEERHRLIVETATEGIWTLDSAGRTTFANQVMADLLAVRREDMLGRSVFDFIPPEDRTAGQAKLGVLMGGTRVALDFRFRRSDGTDVWTQASGAPMLDSHGNVVGALGMLTDITKRRQAEQDLKEAYERLQRVDKDRMQFLNNAAHELGTPLTPIRLQIHMLRTRMASDGADANATKAVEILDRNFERLGHLVRDLLDSARLQANSMRLRLVPIDLRDLVRTSLETYHAPAREAGVTLRVADLPPMPVIVDPSRISQVLDNLLSNAVKFTAKGGNIDIAAQASDGMARVQVHDDGAGMRPEDVPKLFHPFVQVHDTMQATRGGTGLGLYISQGILQAHGGTIRAASKGLGQGSTFSFDIPLSDAASPSPAKAP